MYKIKYIDFGTEKEVVKDIETRILTETVNDKLIGFAIEVYLANKRNANPKTKTRAEVSGGGKKPWKQKGTGRARAGSNRSPLWRKGGVVFGPNSRSYEKKINKKVKKLAIRMAITSKHNENLYIFNNLKLDSNKTKTFLNKITKFEISNAILIFNDIDQNLYLASRNIKNVKCITKNDINIFELIKHNKLLIEDVVLEKLEKELV